MTSLDLLQASCNLLLSAFAEGHEFGSPRYHSSIMDIFLNDSVVSGIRKLIYGG